ncbi:TPA: hypothetical protein DD617_03595 [Candidatus Uhrbacteria bacterium]|nr:hypothetical protein [Candidatus Uhrbacteria bacterium]
MTNNREKISINVPENYENDQSSKIILPVVRFRSFSHTPKEPIFWLNGGPGMSNIKYRPPKNLLANHDVVLVGYRGVDGSVVLDSPKFKRAIRNIDGDALSVTSRERISAAVKDLVRGLRDKNVDPSCYTMNEVVQDIERARTFFGYEKINLLSASYGTRVAQVYTELFPNRLLHSVMIGVNPPGHFIWNPHKIDEQIRIYSELIRVDPAWICEASPEEVMRSALEKMPKKWRFLRMNRAKIRMVTFVLLFSKQTAIPIFEAYRAAYQGDYSGLYALQVAYDLMFPSMFKWGDFYAKGGVDFDDKVNYDEQFHDDSTILGSPLSSLFWITGEEWPIRKGNRPGKSTVKSNAPTLLVSGNLDLSTPAEFARDELLPYLTNGNQIILKEMGHVDDLMGRQSPATNHMITTFFDDGLVDDSYFVYDPIRYKPVFRFQTMAKIFYPLLLLLRLFF